MVNHALRTKVSAAISIYFESQQVKKNPRQLSSDRIGDYCFSLFAE